MIIKRYDAEAQKLVGSKVKPEPWLHVAISKDFYVIYIWDSRLVISSDNYNRADKSATTEWPMDLSDVLRIAKAKLINAVDNRKPLVNNPAIKMAGKDPVYDEVVTKVNKYMTKAGSGLKSDKQNYLVVSLVNENKLLKVVKAVEYHSQSDAIRAFNNADKFNRILFNVADLQNMSASESPLNVAGQVTKATATVWLSAGRSIDALVTKSLQSALSDKDSKSIAGQYAYFDMHAKSGQELCVFSTAEDARKATETKIVVNKARLNDESDKLVPTIIKIQGTKV